MVNGEVTLTASCFHCGEPVPAGVAYRVVIDGASRIVCCAGCAAVAGTIAANGLTAFYAARTDFPRLEFAQRGARRDYADYDIEAVQAPFVRQVRERIKQATLLVEGITCGACAWLIERRLQRLDGVRDVAVNLAAHRLQVEWNAGSLRLSAILSAIDQLGYRIQGFDPAASADAAARERRAMLWRLFVAGFAMMQVMMYALPAYIGGSEVSPEAGQLMRWASLALTVPVMVWSAGPFFRNAWRELRARRVGMDVPVALGIAVAFAASAWATVSGGGAVYFDSITMFVFLLLGARYLELLARVQASAAQQRLIAHTPAVADRIAPGAPGVTQRVPVAQLAPRDLVLVAPGSIIPADGTVRDGESAVDESLLTGEAHPVPKRVGAAVIGGSVNLSSPLTVEVTRVGQETILAGIVRLMDRAQSGKPRIAQLADRVARWFVAVLLAIAAAVAIGWYWIDPERALWVTVAVLVVSCPCALSLATPAALAAATGALHRLGILVTRGQALETLERATHVVFDKTGTLTLGRLALIGVIPLGSLGRDECLALAVALERGSEHPVARVLRATAGGSAPIVPEKAHHHAGQGIEARVDGVRFRIGRPAFVAGILGGRLPHELVYMADSVTVVALADERGYLALFTFGDAIRPGARRLVRELEARGKTVCLLSGDRGEIAANLARSLGIAHAVGDADPQAKLAFVRKLQAQGAVVAMVGDGVNDAPVLSQAQVAIAMGGGTDLAHVHADMILLSSDLFRLADAVDTARATMRIIRQNLAWAAAYNAVALPLAIAGWVTPLAAGIGMAVSSLAVVANALRLSPGRWPGGSGNDPRASAPS